MAAGTPLQSARQADLERPAHVREVVGVVGERAVQAYAARSRKHVLGVQLLGGSRMDRRQAQRVRRRVPVHGSTRGSAGGTTRGTRPAQRTERDTWQVRA